MFHSDQSECYIQASKKRFIIFIFCITKFKHMFVHSAWTHGAMLELKNRKKKNPGFLDFNQKMGKTVAAKLVLTFLPYRLWTCHLSRSREK